MQNKLKNIKINNKFLNEKNNFQQFANKNKTTFVRTMQSIFEDLTHSFCTSVFSIASECIIKFSDNTRGLHNFRFSLNSFRVQILQLSSCYLK